MGFNPFSAISDAVRAVGHVAEEGGKALEDGGKAFEGALSEAAKTARSMSLSDLGHTALDVVGMVPVLGSVANLANAGWYAEQGNWAAAAGSAAAAIPLAGDGVDAAKLGDDAVKLGEDAVRAEQATTTATSGARVLDHVADAGTKVLKAGKAVAPVAAAAPGAIAAVTKAVHGDWRGAALSAVSAIPLGHLHLPVAMRIGDDAEQTVRDDANVAEPDVRAPQSPSAAMRANANDDGTYLDPITDEWLPANETLGADHIIPQSWIKRQPGFEQLTREQQGDVLNDPTNTQGLPGKLNSSKGSKMPGDWNTFKGQPLDPSHVADQAKQAEELRNYITARIDSMLGR
jgi:hypothetical protein